MQKHTGFIFGFYLLLLVSCSEQDIIVSTPTSADNKYDSEFPQQSVSKDLAYVSQTVKKLDCLVFYMNYYFPPGNNFSREQITDSLIRYASTSNEVINESVTGTSTIIYRDQNQIGLLTCAHVVDFPDTIFSYYPEETGGIRVAAVKIKHQVFITGLSQGEDISILIKDSEKDLAILKKVLDPLQQSLSVLNFPVGKTRDLDWGSVVYVVGYPLGNLMVTNAIVSNPEKAENGTFLTNALYNRGISGSPVLAIRDGNSNFEFVGIASTASAKTVQYLTPETDEPFLTNADGSYSGRIFTDQRKDINYGITNSISIEEITGIIKKNRSLLEKEGFQYDLFFK